MQQLRGSVCAPPNICEPLYYMNLGQLGPTIGQASLDDALKVIEEHTTRGRHRA